MDMYINIDLDKVEQFINSDKFSQFLLNNTTDFGTAAAILQFCWDGLAAARSEANETPC